MAYTDIWTAANDATFQGRCQVAMWKAAQDISAESTGTADHVNRYNWATKVLQGTAKITPHQLAMQVLRNGTIANSPNTALDGDIQFQVNSIIADLNVIG